MHISVRLSAGYHVFCNHTQQTSQKATPTGSALHWLYYKMMIFVKVLRGCYTCLFGTLEQSPVCRYVDNQCIETSGGVLQCVINPWPACISLSVCLPVTTFSATTRNKPAKKQHQRVHRYTGFIIKL